MKNFKIIYILIISSLLLISCGIYKPVDSRKVPASAKERAQQNINEGRGASIGNIIGKNRTGGSFEFSSSNPMWRASLETLDFMPINTVDYSGGVIITDWYNDSQKSNEFIKITIRFLATEIRSDSLKVIVHRKKCNAQNNCLVKLHQSKISEELTFTILKKASLLDKKSKKK